MLIAIHVNSYIGDAKYGKCGTFTLSHSSVDRTLIAVVFSFSSPSCISLLVPRVQSARTPLASLHIV